MDIIIVIAIIALAIGAFFAVNTYRTKVVNAEIDAAKLKAASIIEESTREMEAKKKEVLLEAKEETIRIKNEDEKEIKERRNELQRLERRLLQKEDLLDKKIEASEKNEEQIQKKNASLDQLKEKFVKIEKEKQDELERISGFTTEQAKEHLFSIIQNEVKKETAIMIKEMESNAKQEGEKKAKNILANVIQRCAVDHIAETTVSVVSLPNDEMKGRIIGREGRNIRTLESLTGIELIIDDTPEAVILSGFDPMRREVARIALEKLIIDGRIHPARIEEMVEKAKKEVETKIKEEGESACFETGIHGLHSEMVKLLGKMKFRTSYGQNVLQHSIEVAHLSGMLAAELGADITLAKRAGLLHDLGKSVDHDVEGSHVTIGASLCKKYRESDIIINAVESHHGDVEPTNIISIIVQTADAISAARPGARRETLEYYIKRLQSLETIADNFNGVEKSFAIQAGRELRIIIIPEEVDDTSMTLLARDIARKIEDDLEHQYPGQIKVNLIRETRAIDYAK